MYFYLNSGMDLDRVDREILKNLLADARLSARQIGLKLGVSTVTIISRMKRLEEQKIIREYSAITDHEKLGYAITAIAEVVAKKSKIIDIESELSKIENVCGVYDVTGNTDTVIIAKFRDRNELSCFVKKLSTMPNVENTITHIVLNTTKEDFRLA